MLYGVCAKRDLILIRLSITVLYVCKISSPSFKLQSTRSQVTPSTTYTNSKRKTPENIAFNNNCQMTAQIQLFCAIKIKMTIRQRLKGGAELALAGGITLPVRLNKRD